VFAGLVAVVMIVGALALAGCRPGAGGGGDAVVPLIFTAQTHGRLTHCGCFSGQYGGLARLRTALAMEPFAGSLGVDVGDALGGPEDYHLLKYREIVKAYSDMHYVALNAGQREATLPVATLRRLAAESPVPLIGANLLDRATGRPVLPGWTVVKHAGRRIAFVGVVDPHGLEDTLGEGLTVEDMATSLGRILPEVKREADTLVLLAFTDEAGLAALAERFYEFQLVLGGKVSQPAQALRKQGQTYIYYTANESKSFGSLKLVLPADGRPYVREHAITLLDQRYGENEDILDLLRAYQTEVGRAVLTVDSRDHAMEGQVPGVRAASDYAGTQSCVFCHPGAAAVWQKTGHAHAFDALMVKGAQSDPGCIGCHTVGFGTPSGYRREYGAAKLTQVGCESCHGPGATHVEQRRAGGPVTAHFRPLGPGDCLKCHQGEFSRPFDWVKFWPNIEHGKEPKS
jgi:2',3'-cyclic-nucleotide 2'-phosphodiesterase (5'-nucleotidase family)